MSNRAHDDIERVRQSLRHAFAKRRYWESRKLTPDIHRQIEEAGGEFGLGRPTQPSDREKLYSSFYLIGKDYMDYLIPVLLESIMDAYLQNEDRTSLSGDISVLIGLLDVPTLLPQDMSNTLENTFGKDEVQYRMEVRETLRKAKIKRFEGFDRDQSRAVYEWLVLITNWSDIFLLPSIHEQLNRAIDYWNDRCHHS